jgi:hypothetical protein
MTLATQKGIQEPRIQSIPEYKSTRGDEAIELAAAVGLFLDPWQQLVLRHSLAESPTEKEKWAAFEIGLIVPRQNGKGSILEARELAGLFLFDERLILHSAHEFKTAAEAFIRIRSLVDNSDMLRRRVKIIRTGVGSEGIELKNGNRTIPLTWRLTRTRGLRRIPDWVFGCQTSTPCGSIAQWRVARSRLSASGSVTGQRIRRKGGRLSGEKPGPS